MVSRKSSHRVLYRHWWGLEAVKKTCFNLSSNGKDVTLEYQNNKLMERVGVSDFSSQSVVFFLANGPLTRNVKLWAAHAPGMPGTFFLRPTSKETVMHVGIANQRWRGKRSRRMRNPKFYVSDKRPMGHIAWRPFIGLLSSCPIHQFFVLIVINFHNIASFLQVEYKNVYTVDANPYKVNIEYNA